MGDYFGSGIMMFRRMRKIRGDWVKVKKVWLVRECMRENFNDGVEVEDVMLGERLEGEDGESIKGVRKEGVLKIKKVIEEKDG